VELNNVLPLSVNSASEAAQIFAHLRRTGNVIGHNNFLIAGIALENDMTLITNNLQDFSRIEQQFLM